MTTPIREAAVAAIATRLAAQIPTATVQRSRRAPVDVDNESLPRLVIEPGDWSADLTAEPLITHYTMPFTILGYVSARTDLLADQALSDLHAATVAALATWAPDVDGMDTPIEEGADIGLLPADESAKPVGRFEARFNLLITAATGAPYTG